MKQVLVTGADGFVGKHLVRELTEHDIEVVRLLGPRGKSDGEQAYALDLTDTASLADIDLSDVDGVIHLAGLAAVGPSFDNPQKYIEANSAMVTNLCEYFLKREQTPRILLVSSGAIYDSFQPMPITEESAFGFNSPYAVSKILNENQAAYYRKRGLEVVVARPFNHIGPGQLPGFIVPDLIQQLEVSKRNGDALMVGNLETKRDYTDVRDVATAYRLLITAPKLSHHTYNVCSGTSSSGKEILRSLQEFMQAEDVSVEVDQSKIRPNDPQDIYGDTTRLKSDTGWQPQYSLDQTLRDCLL